MNPTDSAAMLAQRDVLRRRAENMRRKAGATGVPPIAAHLFYAAARHYDDAAARLVRADKAEADALRYEREPGGGDHCPPAGPAVPRDVGGAG